MEQLCVFILPEKSILELRDLSWQRLTEGSTRSSIKTILYEDLEIVVLGASLM